MAPKSLILIIALVVITSGCVSETNQSTESIIISLKESDSTDFVSRVIDGDTIELLSGDRVRLLGINTPELGQPYYEESKSRLKGLVEGRVVKLERDAKDRDQYNRLLRYVFLNNQNINLQLVEEGMGSAYVIPPNVKYENQLREAQDVAKSRGIGIWEKAVSNKEGICDNSCIGIANINWNAEGNDCDNLNDEYVVFSNSCSHPCDLTGWTVKDDSSRDPYVFPDFVLESNFQVNLRSGCGSDTQSDLYWCESGYSCNAIWNNDEDTVFLRDSDGMLVLGHGYVGV